MTELQILGLTAIVFYSGLFFGAYIAYTNDDQVSGSPTPRRLTTQGRLMTEKPILFSGPMVRAILDGHKTQTRRVCRDQTASEYKFVTDMKTIPTGPSYSGWAKDCGQSFILSTKCPFGQPGDRLWVRENFQPLYADGYFMEDVDYETGHGYAPKYMATEPAQEYLDHNTDETTDRITPSIHMPRWACRLILEVTAVRVERLQDITNADARAEGIPEYGTDANKYLGWSHGHGDVIWDNNSSVENYFWLWNSLNAKRGYGWDTNPWVWVIDFEKIDPV